MIKLTNPDGTLFSCTYQGSDGLRRTYQSAGDAVTQLLWDNSNYLGEVS